MRAALVADDGTRYFQSMPAVSFPFRCLTFGIALALLGWVASRATAADSPPDFVKDIRPLLANHCWSCHSAAKQLGHLRLDTAPFARQGGNSQQNLLTSDLSQNLLLKRLRSNDAAVRMPHESPPLTMVQIGFVERWLAAGAPWPNENKPPEKPLEWYERLAFLVDLHVEHLYPAGGMFLVCLVFILLLEQGRRRGQDAGCTWAWKNIGNCARNLGYGGYWALLLGCLVSGLFLHVNYLKREITNLRVVRSVNNGNTTSGAIDASENQPPKLFRPQHPPRLGGVYYRGNDERNERLFNGGFYRTAIMEVYLCGGDKQLLAWNDPLPNDGCQLRFIIRRAPMATPTLFTPEIMQGIFLSQSSPGLERANVAEERVLLTELEPGEHWEAWYPLPALTEGERRTGTLYIQQGRLEKGKLSGTVHFGIGYDLLVAEGKVSPKSEVWLGTVYVPTVVIPPSPSQITIYEWLDFRPIPEIEGGNSTDPKLLGVEQYLGPQPTSKGENQPPGE